MKVFESLKNFFKRYKLVSFGVFVLFVIGLITVPRIFAELQPVKSVEILSEKSNYNDKEAGSFKIDKSASFKTIDTCLVTIDLETISKSSDRGQDIVFIIDTSESMTGEKLNMMKIGVINAINEVLANDKNRVGLTFFNNISSIESNLSNDKELLINKVNSLTVSEGTNYYQALVGLDNFLETYQNDDRDFKVVFITDGLPNMNHPNEVGEYNYLKDKYPYLRFEAVQYEISEDVLEEIENISDKQYVSNRDNFNDIIKSIVKGSNKFEEFRVRDFINSEVFNVEDITDIKVDRGSVSLDNNTISWNLDDVMSFNKARMTYKLKLNKTSERIYPVGEKIKVNSKLGEIVEEIDSPKTPVLSNSYKVIYDGNEPEGCNVDKVPKENSYSVFDTVGISEVEPVCSGYQFKGWDITTSGVSKINDDYFTMPEADVILKAKWSKLDIKKSMDGKVKESLTLYKQVQQDVSDSTKYAKKYTGLTDTFNGNEDVYYYYGKAANNNVIFGDYCWKIVRTTDTGGVKLLYNGVPSSDSKCNNSGDASALTKEQMGTSSNQVAFNSSSNSPADVGYMYNKRYTTNYKAMKKTQTILGFKSMSTSTSYNYYYSDSYTWNGSTYELNNPERLIWIDNYQNLVGKYTCQSVLNTGGCINLSYVVKAATNRMYYITLENGKGLPASGYEETITFGDSINDNGDGTYTLSNPLKINKNNWVNNYKNYNNYYTCGNNEIKCYDMKYITETSNTSIKYINGVPYKYGNSFTWDGTNYTLVDTIEIWDWPSDYSIINNNHYTCFNSSGVCNELNYIYYLSSGIPYYVKLNNGKSIEDALNKMFYNEDVNTNDSTIKSAIDYWYLNNMTQYTDYLEDTVWCNDRSMSNQSTNGWNPNGGSTSTYLNFKSYGNSSNLTCQNRNDRFSVNKENGNGALKYPVGLITRQEQGLSSYGGGSPLVSGNSYWGITPSYFDDSFAFGEYIPFSVSFDSQFISQPLSVRPAVSLRAGLEYINGDGSSDTPYVIDMD